MQLTNLLGIPFENKQGFQIEKKQEEIVKQAVIALSRRDNGGLVS